MNDKTIRKRWVPKVIPDNDIINKLQKELGINSFLAKLIALRNINSYEDAKQFFNPDKKEIHDPFLMKGMKTAVNRIKEAITNNQRILIYGDYDVDGTTAVSLIYNFLTEFYSNVEYYIPDRFLEGYGISLDGIDWAKNNNIKLIIALDCGIKAIEPAQYAKDNNIDLIICDHHNPGEKLPIALAILNPKQIECNYPYKDLSGCGIGFKLIQAYTSFERNNIDPFKFSDLVAVSIASDIVPMTGENRILTALGLEKLNSDPMPGLKALIDISEIKRELNVSDIVFTIGPRLNASGRMADANESVNLLVTDNEETRLTLAKKINTRNQERKDVDHSITEEALKMIDENVDLQNKKTTVLYNRNWHLGVLGIVASRLIEHYHRPTIILAESEEYVTGSARSVPGFNLYDAVASCSHLLERFGGHQYAAGLSLKLENLEKFKIEFEEIVQKTIKPELLIPVIDYDTELPFSNITKNFMQSLKRFAPFGPGNLNPIFITTNVQLAYPPRIVGTNHLKLEIKEPDSQTFNAIAFGMGNYSEQMKIGKTFDICYTIEENVWNDIKSIQLNIKDIHINEN